MATRARSSTLTGELGANMGIASGIDILRGNGQYEVREVLRMVWFLRRPHLDSNQAVYEAIQNLMRSPVGSGWRHASDPSGDWRAGTPEALTREVQEAIVDSAGTINGTISLSNDPTQSVPDFYMEYSGFAIDRPRFKDRAGFLFLWVPEPWFRSNEAVVVSTARNIASTLPISFAYADLALVGKSERVQQLARRYVGLDVADVSSTAIDLGDKVSGAYWLNIYSDSTAVSMREWREESPIRERAWSGSELPSGRFMLIANSGPVRGDRNRHESLSDREELAMALLKRGVLHVPMRSTYFEKTAEHPGAELQVMWHRRFVDKSW